MTIKMGFKLLLGLCVSVLPIGCATDTQTGALAGAGVGGVAGGVLGSVFHAPLAGAALGAGTGALIGGSAGAQSDAQKQQAQMQAAAAASGPPMTIGDVIELTRTNTPEGIIINQIRSTRSAFTLSTADIQLLQDNRVSPNVIVEMQARPPGYYYPRRYYGYPPPPPPAVGVGVIVR